jgi:UDP-hydrolysing UDP-N-acetyl-D-glucosamine 2-epimerase
MIKLKKKKYRKIKLYFVVSGRSDYGPSSSILKKIAKDKFFSLYICLTLSGLANKNVEKEITGDGLRIKKKIKFKHKILSNSISYLISKFNNDFRSIKPDFLVIMGDRFEVFAASIAAFTNNIRIAHISGGEDTFGSLDNIYRNSITKMSSIHFATNKLYKNNIVKMGELEKNIYIVGEPFEEIFTNCNKFSKSFLEKKFQFKFYNKNFLVTYHPDTTQKEEFNINNLKTLLNSIKDFKNYIFIFNESNIDQNYNKINKIIKNFCKYNSNCIFIPTLGYKYYYSFLSIVDGLIGNSSSGVIEAPIIGLPSINLGDRQLGRVNNRIYKTILNAPFNKNLIKILIKYIANKRIVNDMLIKKNNQLSSSKFILGLKRSLNIRLINKFLND